MAANKHNKKKNKGQLKYLRRKKSGVMQMLKENAR